MRLQARLALAMLPVGGTMFVGSTLALLTVTAMAVDLVVHARFGWPLAWSLAASAAALWNARAGIAMMCAFDWRPLPLTLALSAAVVASWLALP